MPGSLGRREGRDALPALDFSRALPRLLKSKFRSRFKLDRDDLAYLERIGPEKLRRHAADFVQKRLAPAFPVNDGKQTPFRGHPVFKAQHAAAACCRGCLAKWHSIPKGRPLTDDECQSLRRLLLDWIEWSAHRHGDPGARKEDPVADRSK